MTVSNYFTKISEIVWFRDSKERLNCGERAVPLRNVLQVIAALENRIGPITIEEDGDDTRTD